MARVQKLCFSRAPNTKAPFALKTPEKANDGGLRICVLPATLLHNSLAACVSNGRLITLSTPNLSRMQMWLLTCDAIVELPHNALRIYNVPLREFADLIGTLLRITSCTVSLRCCHMQTHGSNPLQELALGSGLQPAEQVGVAGMGRPPVCTW